MSIIYVIGKLRIITSKIVKLKSIVQKQATRIVYFAFSNIVY